MRRPSTDNSIENGDGNTQIGHNSGTITVGYTVQEHEAALEKALTDKAAALERAHGAERALLQNELDTIKSKLADVEKDHKERLEELESTKRLLARYDNRLNNEKREAAYRALDAGETTLAQALLKELAQQASARREDAASEEAEFEFELGKLAETEVRWADAAAHYARAAQLIPRFETLKKASEFAERAGDYRAAANFSEALLSSVGKEGVTERHASALNEHAVNVRQLGQLDDAEKLLRKALDITGDTLGKENTVYATYLNNLAAVLSTQGRYVEAETLARQVLKIDPPSLDKPRLEDAGHLNNLATALKEQSRYKEAEPLYRQVLKIHLALGYEAHPDYATFLNNLGEVLRNQGNQGRYAEAENFYHQALGILRQAHGEKHPEYARVLNNIALLTTQQGRHDEALEYHFSALKIIRENPGEQQVDHATGLNNLAGTLWKRGNLVEAERNFQKALAILERQWPANHPNLLVLLYNLEKIRAEMG